MDDDATPQTPTPPAPTPSPERRGRLGRVAVSVVVVIGLAVTGTGVGYAAGLRQGTSGGSAASVTSSPSSQRMPGGSDERQLERQAPEDQQEQQDTTTDTTTDTTGKASGEQLTGLVRIVSTMQYAGSKAAGTGMVLTADGEVVTNHHVVEGATSIEVTVMSTGATYTARVVGTDDSADVAVLQLSDASGLATVATDDDTVSAGDAVTAVGDGNGTVAYLGSATGSVLAIGQSITTQASQGAGAAQGERLSGLIEISSDVVGGYSGGATYDDEGEVLGMTTAASSGTSDIVGYSIPIATVLSIARDLESGVSGSDYVYGYPAFLGVGLADGAGAGTTVGEVYDATPAAEAGIEAGETITAVDSTATGTGAALQAAIAEHAPGDSVQITWTDTDGERQTAAITLAAGPVR